MFKKPALADFSRVSEPDPVVGKHVAAIVAGHGVKGLFAALGQDHGIGGTDRGKITGIRLSAGTEPVVAGFKTGMKRQDHGISHRISGLHSITGEKTTLAP